MQLKFCAIAAITLDGKIAKSSSHTFEWTSKEDKEFLHEQLKLYDSIIVGRRTFELHKRELLKYDTVVLSRKETTSGMHNAKYMNPKKESLNKYLETKQYRKNAVLGGQEIYTYFLKHDLLDELYITVEPVIFGKGLTMFNKTAKSNFTLESCHQLNNQGTLLLHYIRV